MRLDEVLEIFEEFLKKSAPKLDGFHPHLQKAFWEMILAGGKRFRPRLFLGVINATNSLLLASAMPVALAIEAIHTYSLIHDDLPAMDNASLRRGHPTLHTTYNETIAILVGDALNTYAFELISNASLSDTIKIALIKELSNAAGIHGMVLGQALDCHFEHNMLPFEQLRFIHLHKTARLIAASLKMGAIVSLLEKDLQDRLYEFGLKLGLLFQINDDIIDRTKDTKTSGKDTNKDIHKNSYVNLLGLDGALFEKDRLICELEILCDSFDERLKKMLSELITPFKE